MIQFAAAIWTIDYELGLAANNYSAAYLHTREPGVTYDIFQYPNVSAGVANSGWSTGPQYYSLLLLADAFSTLQSNSRSRENANGTIVVDLNIANHTRTAGYALYDASTTTIGLPRTLVLMNFANGTSPPSASTSTTFLIPDQIPKARVRILTAPSLNDKSSALITYAGQSMDAAGTGALQGKLSEQEVECANGVGCTIEVPGPGVAVVFVQEKDGSLQTKTSDSRRRVTLIDGRNDRVVDHAYGLIIGMVLGVLMAVLGGLV